MIEFEIKGLRELDEELKNFPMELQKKALGTMVAAGGRFVRDEAINNFKGVAKTTGTDKIVKEQSLKNIVLRRLKKRDKNQSTLTYGIMAQFPAYFMETGTTPHTITAKKAKALGKKGIFGKSVKHPGFAARPFLRPAIDNNVRKIVDIMADKLQKWINTKYKKLSKESWGSL